MWVFLGHRPETNTAQESGMTKRSKIMYELMIYVDMRSAWFSIFKKKKIMILHFVKTMEFVSKF